MRTKFLETIKRYYASITAFVVLLVAWQALVELLKIPSYLIPAPSAVIMKIFDPSMGWPVHVLTTSYETLAGFAIAVLIGVSTAVLIIWSEGFSKVVYPFVVTMQIVPKIAFVPLLFVWLGLDYTPKIITVFLVCYFPIVIGTVTGFSSTEPSMIDLIRSYTSSKLDLLIKALFPSALPSMFAGFKISITLALIGALVAEFVSSTQGLGFVILSSQSELNMTVAFAATAILILIGFLLYIGIEVLERVLVPWRAKLALRR